MKLNRENPSEVKLLIIVLAFIALAIVLLGLISNAVVLGITDY